MMTKIHMTFWSSELRAIIKNRMNSVVPEGKSVPAKLVGLYHIYNNILSINRVTVFNATFNNISAISRRSSL